MLQRGSPSLFVMSPWLEKDLSRCHQNHSSWNYSSVANSLPCTWPWVCLWTWSLGSCLALCVHLSLVALWGTLRVGRPALVTTELYRLSRTFRFPMDHTVAHVYPPQSGYTFQSLNKPVASQERHSLLRKLNKAVWWKSLLLKDLRQTFKGRK